MLLIEHNSLKAGMPVHAYSAYAMMRFSKGQSVLCVQACDAVQGPG